jgi:RimJ/RimL family protein N-acetyltransferase
MPEFKEREIVIRTAMPQDALMILRLSRAIITDSDFNITTPEEFNISVAEEEEWIRGFIRDNNSILMVADKANEVIGMLNFRGSPRKRLKHTGEIGIGVAKQYRGMGIGTLLLESLISWAKEHPVIEKLELNVFEKNIAGIRLYQKMGFIVQGKLSKQIKLGEGAYTDLILMARFVK